MLQCSCCHVYRTSVVWLSWAAKLSNFADVQLLMTHKPISCLLFSPVFTSSRSQKNKPRKFPRGCFKNMFLFQRLIHTNKEMQHGNMIQLWSLHVKFPRHIVCAPRFVPCLRAKTSEAAANNGVKAMESTEVVTFGLKEFPHWEPPKSMRSWLFMEGIDFDHHLGWSKTLVNL